tara:strand:+ start:31 stop:969 length:939 start_codon:yes stop_codon:yes gene_type:complete
MRKILVLEGGFNEEHEISLKTSREVQKSLKKLNYLYEVLSVNPRNFFKIVENYKENFLCFNALHGTYGEDGQIQKILERNKILFTHSSSKSSKIAFNKNLTKLSIKETGVKFLDYVVCNKSQINKEFLENAFSRFKSFVIKPVSSGSSFGIKILKTPTDIENFILKYDSEMIIYKNHDELMIEKYINGREMTVTVFEDNNKSESIAVTEIISKNNFFDYNAKYTKGLSSHIIPANLTKEIYDKCMSYAKIIHDKIGCKNLSRSDFLFSEDEIYFLEINSQPGLTPLSLVPEQLMYKNINFDLLIKKIIESSL